MTLSCPNFERVVEGFVKTLDENYQIDLYTIVNSYFGHEDNDE